MAERVYLETEIKDFFVRMYKRAGKVGRVGLLATAVGVATTLPAAARTFSEAIAAWTNFELDTSEASDDAVRREQRSAGSDGLDEPAQDAAVYEAVDEAVDEPWITLTLGGGAAVAVAGLTAVAVDGGMRRQRESEPGPDVTPAAAA